MPRNLDDAIRVGSRKSELALIQTKYVIGRLQELNPNRKFEIHTMATIGDKVLNVSLPKIGEKSLFTRDLEDALGNGGIDFVVHSLKDLPTTLPKGMAIGAVLKREDARDALVLRNNLAGHTIETLPAGSIIGTSSLRRTAQLARCYPQLVVCDIRGNLNTRLAKLDAPDSKFAGIILAQAGLVRMGWNSRISQVLEPTSMLYAVGQGALAVECLASDQEILGMLQQLTCLTTSCRILAERSFLKTLGGGCSAPVAVKTVLNSSFGSDSRSSIALSLTGAVWSLDGIVELRAEAECCLNQSAQKRKAEENGAGTSSSAVGSKRARSELNEENTNGQVAPATIRAHQHSPPIINDDVVPLKALTTSYDVDKLIERHIDLAKQCPVVGKKSGDKRVADAVDGLPNPHCPMPINVGQDFMGECPFVSNEAKVTFAAGPTTSKCPFTALHAGSASIGTKIINESSNNNNETKNGTKVKKSIPSTVNCPFLLKAVQLFDYEDEEKPLPKCQDVDLSNSEQLLCGLYQHACYSRELYERSLNLGQQLAEQLIKKGALEIMAVAQAEIHSKIK